MTGSPSAGRPTSRSASFIGSVTLAGRLLERAGAFGQILLIAAVLGASVSADLYFIASIVPLTIGGIVGEALFATVLPPLTRRGDESVVGLIKAGFWVAVVLLTSLTLMYVAVAAVVVEWTEPAGSNRLAVWLAFTPIAALLGVGSYFAAVLLRYERYVWPPFRAGVATVCALALTAIALKASDDVLWVAVAVTVGYALSFILLAVEVGIAVGRTAFGLPSSAELRQVLGLWRKFLVATSGNALGGQVFVLIERALAASLGVGAVAAISYGRGVAFTPNIIALSISLGLYPGMLRAHAAHDLNFLRRSLIGGVRLTVFIGLCTASFLVFYSESITSVLFDRGSVSAASLEDIQQTIAAFSIGLSGTMLTIFAGRFFAAIDRMHGLVICQAFALSIYVPLALVLRPTFGPAGLALAFGVAELLSGVLGLWMFARMIHMDAMLLLRKITFAAVPRALCVVAVLAAFRYGLNPQSDVVTLAGGLALGGLAALVLLWTSGWPEVHVLRRVWRTVQR